MTVVTLHPVIIQFEGVLRRFLVVDENLAVLHLEFITLVGADRTLVDRQVL